MPITVLQAFEDITGKGTSEETSFFGREIGIRTGFYIKAKSKKEYAPRYQSKNLKRKNRGVYIKEKNFKNSQSREKNNYSEKNNNSEKKNNYLFSRQNSKEEEGKKINIVGCNIRTLNETSQEYIKKFLKDKDVDVLLLNECYFNEKHEFKYTNIRVFSLRTKKQESFTRRNFKQTK